MLSKPANAMAADQRLVRPAFGRFGLSGNGLVLRKIRGGSRAQVMFGLPLVLSFSSRGELLWRSEGDLTVISVKSRTETGSVGSISPSPPACTIMILLAAGPDGRCCKTEESPNSAEQCAG